MAGRVKVKYSSGTHIASWLSKMAENQFVPKFKLVVEFRDLYAVINFMALVPQLKDVLDSSLGISYKLE